MLNGNEGCWALFLWILYQHQWACITALPSSASPNITGWRNGRALRAQQHNKITALVFESGAEGCWQRGKEKWHHFQRRKKVKRRRTKERKQERKKWNVFCRFMSYSILSSSVVFLSSFLMRLRFSSVSLSGHRPFTAGQTCLNTDAQCSWTLLRADTLGPQPGLVLDPAGSCWLRCVARTKEYQSPASLKRFRLGFVGHFHQPWEKRFSTNILKQLKRQLLVNFNLKGVFSEDKLSREHKYLQYYLKKIH